MEAEDNRDASQKLLEKFKQTFDTKRADNLTPEGWQSADETIMIFPKGVEKVGFVRTDNFSPVGYVGEDEIVTNSKTFKTYTFSRNETTHHLHRQRVDKVLTVLGVDETYLLENTLSRWDLGDDHPVVIDTETDYYIIVAPVFSTSSSR